MDRRRDAGFTLIELMVVVLIIAILLAIAIPTFLGARERANARAAQSNLRNLLTNQLTFFADGQQFTESEPALLELEPSLEYSVPANAIDPPAALTATGVIYVDVVQTFRPGDTVILGSRTPDGRCFWIRNVGDNNLPRFGENNCIGNPATLIYGDAW